MLPKDIQRYLDRGNNIKKNYNRTEKRKYNCK